MSDENVLGEIVVSLLKIGGFLMVTFFIQHLLQQSVAWLYDTLIWRGLFREGRNPNDIVAIITEVGPSFEGGPEERARLNARAGTYRRAKDGTITRD